MVADVLIANHGFVALFTSMIGKRHKWIDERVRLNCGKGWDVPSLANSAA